MGTDNQTRARCQTMDEDHEVVGDITRLAGETEDCEVQLRTVAVLTAALAHEIRSPLGTIANVVFLLGQRQGHDRATGQRLELAQEAVERISRVIESFLLFSKLDFRSPEDLDLRSFLPQASERDPRLSQSEEGDWRVRGSPDMLQLALRLILQPVGSVEGHRLMGAHREGPWLVLSFSGASDPQEHALREWRDAFKLAVCLVRVLIEGQGGFVREEWLGMDHRLTVGLKASARLSRAA